MNEQERSEGREASIQRTRQAMADQEQFREMGVHSGKGVCEQSQHGAFIVYARLSPDALLKYIQERRPSVGKLEEMHTIFLMGPTPRFYGDERASTSWRREFVAYMDETPLFDSRFLVVVPEPRDCDWTSVDYPGVTRPVEHIYGQLHWEDYFISLASETGVLVLHAHFRWGGNAGPTARIEAGRLMTLLRKGSLCAAVINYPCDTETAQYIEAHLMYANTHLMYGLFLLSDCSPLALDESGKPVGADGVVRPAGVYESGASEEGRLRPFFDDIATVAQGFVDNLVEIERWQAKCAFYSAKK